MRAALGSVLISVFLATSVVHAAGLIAWVPNIQTAQRIAADQNRLVLLHFWAPDCPPCREVERSVFTSPVVAETMRQDYVAVKVNAYDSPALRMQYKVERWPTDVVTTPDGKMVHSMVSSQDPREYVRMLGAIAGSEASRQPPTTSSPWSQSPFQGATGGPGSQMVTNTNAQAYPSRDNPGGGSYANTPTHGEVINQYVSHSRPASQPPGLTAHSGTPAANMTGDASQRVENRFAVDRRPSPESHVNGESRWGTGGSVNNPYASEPSRSEPQVAQYDTAPRFASPRANDHKQTPPPSNQANDAPQHNFVTSHVSQEATEALNGHCPVTLCTQQKWRKGDTRWGAVHRGRTYLFAGADEQRQFLAEPDLYSPVLSGIDPVRLAESGEIVQGKRQHGVVYREQIYLFDSEDSLSRFWSSPERYAAPVRQAMQTGNLQGLLR